MLMQCSVGCSVRSNAAIQVFCSADVDEKSTLVPQSCDNEGVTMQQPFCPFLFLFIFIKNIFLVFASTKYFGCLKKVTMNRKKVKVTFLIILGRMKPWFLLVIIGLESDTTFSDLLGDEESYGLQATGKPSLDSECLSMNYPLRAHICASRPKNAVSRS